MQSHAVKDFRMARHLRMSDDRAIQLFEHFNDARDAAYAREYAILFYDDRRRGALLLVDHGISSSVARRLVFQERVFQDRRDASAVPVQCRLSAAIARVRILFIHAPQPPFLDSSPACHPERRQSSELSP